MTPRIVDAARDALQAYEDRFSSILGGGNYTGPIDEEMKALHAALNAPKAERYVATGKSGDYKYSVRTVDGAPVCTCAYNGGYIEDRIEAASLIANALNFYQP